MLTLLVSDVDPVDGCVDVAGLQRLSGPLTSPLRLFVTESRAHLLFNRVFPPTAPPLFLPLLLLLLPPLPCTDLAIYLSLEAVLLFFLPRGLPVAGNVYLIEQG